MSRLIIFWCFVSVKVPHQNYYIHCLNKACFYFERGIGGVISTSVYSNGQWLIKSCQFAEKINI